MTLQCSQLVCFITSKEQNILYILLQKSLQANMKGASVNLSNAVQDMDLTPTRAFCSHIRQLFQNKIFHLAMSRT